MRRLLILDVDGVMTDGTKIYDATGKAVLKRFADQDWTAIKKFKDRGWSVIMLTGDENVNRAIAKERDIDFQHSRGPNGEFDKAPWLPILCERYEVLPQNVHYIGDDLYDASIMEAVVKAGGTIYCPNNSAPQVRNMIMRRNRGFVLDRPGGAGAVMALYYHFHPEDGSAPTCA